MGEPFRVLYARQAVALLWSTKIKPPQKGGFIFVDQRGVSILTGSVHLSRLTSSFDRLRTRYDMLKVFESSLGFLSITKTTQ